MTAITTTDYHTGGEPFRIVTGGVPVLEALKIVKTIVNNAVVEHVLSDVHDRIVEGQDIATPIKKSGLFPPTVGYMIAVGEQSGRLEEILDKLGSLDIDGTTPRQALELLAELKKLSDEN